MPQDKTIKGVIERFRGIFSGDLGHIKAWDKDGKVVNIEDIEQFIQQEIKDALNSREQEIQKNVKHYFDNILYLPCPDFTIKNKI